MNLRLSSRKMICRSMVVAVNPIFLDSCMVSHD